MHSIFFLIIIITISIHNIIYYIITLRNKHNKPVINRIGNRYNFIKYNCLIVSCYFNIFDFTFFLYFPKYIQGLKYHLGTNSLFPCGGLTISGYKHSVL